MTTQRIIQEKRLHSGSVFVVFYAIFLCVYLDHIKLHTEILWAACTVKDMQFVLSIDIPWIRAKFLQSLGIELFSYPVPK